MKILYNNTEIINAANLTPLQTQLEPKIEYNADPNTLYTLIMHDLNAVSENYLHWVVINIPGHNIHNGQTLLKYKGPSPPQGTGAHRYVFLIFEQAGRIILENVVELDRTMSMPNLYKLLHIKTYLISDDGYFISEYQPTGGKKRKRSGKTKKRVLRRKKGTRNH